jgi:hypothetical protein
MEGETITNRRPPALARAALSLILPLALTIGCGGAPVGSGPEATATPAAATMTPADSTPTGAPGTPGGGGSGGSSGSPGEADVQIQGHGLRLDHGHECQLINGVQVSLASADGRDTLDATVATTGAGTLILTVDLVIWQPQGEPTLFEVSGNHATWQGTMASDDGQQAEVEIDIDCAS